MEIFQICIPGTQDSVDIEQVLLRDDEILSVDHNIYSAYTFSHPTRQHFVFTTLQGSGSFTGQNSPLGCKILEGGDFFSLPSSQCLAHHKDLRSMYTNV